MKTKKLYILIVLILILKSFSTFSQLKQLDSTDIAQWQSLKDGKISNSGQWVMYTINNIPLESRTLVVQNTQNDIKYSFSHASAEVAQFSDDSKMAIIKNTKDSLLLFNLSEDKLICYPTINEYQLFKINGKERLLYTSKKNQISDLIIAGTTGEKLVKYTSVRRWWLDEQYSRLWLLQDIVKDGKTMQQLSIANLNNYRELPVWTNDSNSNSSIDELVFNNDGIEVAFTVKYKDSATEIWCYRGNNSLINYPVAQIVTIKGISADLEVDGLEKFSSERNKLLFKLRMRIDYLRHADSIRNNNAQVKVWSYLDPALQNRNNGINQSDKRFLAIVDLKSGRAEQLTKEDETYQIGPDLKWICINHQVGDPVEEYWNNKARRIVHFLNTENGNRIFVEGWGRFGQFSSNGKYYFSIDSVMKNWFCYSTATKRILNITKNIPIPDSDSLMDEPIVKESRGLELAGILPDGKSALFSDRYDLWKVSFDSNTPPICLTEGYGRANHISFRIPGQQTLLDTRVITGDSLLLNAFDQYTKENGFFTINLIGKVKLRKIGMYPAIYDYQYSFDRTPPIKARDQNIYLIMHMSEQDAPNYFTTSNFKTFKALSSIAPQNGINWVVPRLMNWKNKEGNVTQGILYLPQDFDSTKKYPVIISYYEKLTNILHKFPTVSFIGGGLTPLIPWYTGRGYLVFFVDIYFKPGHTGENALEYVESGTDQLIKLPFVDSTRLGIIGHSFGGYETNYIVTHSTRFAAAISTSGRSNLISSYLSNYEYIVKNDLVFTEINQYRMGGDLWKNQELYIRNSPVLSANKVTTPLLLMSNKEDFIVPYNQGMELFIALRRLGKRVWLLQYNHEGHVLRDPVNVMDYLTRTEQYLGHYLKNQPAPEWMTRAEINDIENSHKYDKEILTPGPGIRYDR